MKDWGWVVLLTIGCLISAVIVVLIIEVIKDFPIFRESEVNSIPTTITNNKVIHDSNLPSSIATTTPTSIIMTINKKNQSQQDSNNLISNGSFELNPLTSPPIWETTKQDNQQIIEWSSEQAEKGQHALKISASNPYIGWPGWTTQFNHKTNTGYKLQAKYFTTDGANAWLEIAFLDNNNRLLKGFTSGCPQTSVTNQWTLVERIVKAEWIPEGSHIVRVGLRQCLNFTKGRLTTLYFDNVSLRHFNN